MNPARCTLGMRQQATLALTTLLLAGCQIPLQHRVLGPDYQVSNVFLPATSLPDTFRRVAVLPLATDAATAANIADQTPLGTTLLSELLKTRKVEAVQVTPESLRHLTGRRSWDSVQPLPSNFLVSLREEFACDGVLFVELSSYRAYPPLALGWKLKLIDATNGKVLWAVDELFDMGEPCVANSARRYELTHQKGRPPGCTPLIARSPERFAQYTAWAVFNTLPARGDLLSAHQP